MRKPVMKKLSAKRVALTGILLAFALILTLIENYIPPVIPAFPYAKIGLSNIILICALLLLGYRWCIVIVLIKCIFGGIFSGNMFSLAYSVPAGIIAYTVSAGLFKLPKLSIIAVSVVSSIVHNLVQVAVASLVTTGAIWLISPYLLIIGAASGLGTGLVAYLLLRALPDRFYNLFFEDEITDTPLDSPENAENIK